MARGAAGGWSELSGLGVGAWSGPTAIATSDGLATVFVRGGDRSEWTIAQGWNSWLGWSSLGGG